MKRFQRLFVGVFCVIALSAWGHAELVLNTSVGGQVVDSRGGSVPTFDVVAGDSLTLDIFVTQQGTFLLGGVLEFPDFRLSERAPVGGDQLGGVGAFTVDVSASAAGGGAADAISFSNAQFGAGFIDDTNTGARGDGFRISSFAAPDLSGSELVPVFASQTFETSEASRGDVASNSVRLGSINVDTTFGDEGNYVIEFSNPGDGGSDFILGSSVISGETVVPTFGQAFISVTAVPEPSSMAAIALIGGTVALRRRRSRSKPAV